MVKINISDPKTGRTYQKEVDTKGLVGLKIGEKFDGGKIGLKDYDLQVTGGTDSDGFPMRPDVEGTVRKRLLLANLPGHRPKEKGERRRKFVRGNTISEDIVLINTKVVKHGKKPLDKLLGGEKESENKKK